jgi:hypothetical protein
MKLEPGDIGAVKGKGILQRAAENLMFPKTDRFHFFLIWRKAGDDWIILESVQKGIAVGRLSFYAGQDVKIYRVNCPVSIRRQAPVELTQYGRSKYDYLLLFKIVIQGCWTVLKNFLKGEGIHPIRADDLTWSWDNAFVCTEAVAQAYNMCGLNIIPYGVCPTPSAFKQAELDGLLEEV